MNDKWKKKKTAHYDVFDSLLMPLEKHIGFREDYDEGMNQVQGAIDYFSKHFPYKRRLRELDRAKMSQS